MTDPTALAAQLLATSAPEQAQLIQQLPGPLRPELLALLRAQVDQYKDSDASRALAAANLCLAVADGLDQYSTAAAQWAKAIALTHAGQHGAALVWYDQARQGFTATGRQRDAALTQVGKVQALALLGQYDQAISLAQQAKPALAAQGEELAAARLDINLGNIYLRLDRYSEALQSYDQAREAFLHLGNPEEIALARLDMNRANALTNLDDFPQALAAYQRARAVFAAQQLAAPVAIVDCNLGYLYAQQGAFDLALEHLERARRTFVQLGPPKYVAQMDLEIADVYLDLNLHQEALAAYDRAIQAFASLELRYEQAKALSQRALALAGRQSLDEALQSLDQAAALFAAEGNHTWPAFVSLRRAALLWRLGKLEPARASAQQATQALEALGLRTQQARAALLWGELCAALGQPIEAATWGSQALQTAQELALPQLAGSAHQLLGNLAGQQGDVAAAIRHYQQAVGHIEHIRATLPTEELRTAFLEDKLAVYQNLVLTCLRSKEQVAEAFAYVERAKSRALIDLLAGQLTTRRPPQDAFEAELVQRLEALRSELNWYYSRLNSAESQDRAQAIAGRLQAQASHREQEVANIIRQLQATSREAASLYQVSAPSATEVQRWLGDQLVLLEYFVAGDEVLAFVLDASGIMVYRHLAAVNQVRDLSQQLRFQLSKFHYGSNYLRVHQGALRATVQDSLQALYRQLLAPLAPALADRGLVIVPHGPLHYLPFHALYDGRQYLLERHQVSYAPSAAVWQMCLGKQPRALGPALVLGVPDQGIPYVLDEVRGVGQTLGQARVLIGAEATTEALRRWGPEARLIHLASHGAFRADNPLFSALRLGDGWLTAREVYGLELRGTLVTLSACDTGLNQVAAGDELIGLARGFLYAGAPSLVVSLWTVHDQAAAALMQHFYTALSQGLGKAAALRLAQLETLADHPHPYYWAPFVLMGQGQ